MYTQWSYVRNVDNPTEVCEQLDEIEHDFFHLNGYRKGEKIGEVYRQMFVYDKQIWGG